MNLMRANLTISQKVLVLVAVPLIFELAFIGLLAFRLYQSEREVEREAHARSIISRTNDTIEKILNIAAGGALFNISGGDHGYLTYERTLEEIPRELQQLATDLEGEPDRQSSARDAVAIWSRAQVEATELKRLIADGNQFAAVQKFPRLKRIVAELTGNLHKIVRDEKPAQQKSIQNQAALRQQVFTLLIAGAIINVLLAIALAVFFNKSTTQRLSTILDNSVRLGAGKPINPLLPGSDEIAQVDKTFHLMAYELNRAAEKERELLDQTIASERQIRTIIDSMPVGLLLLDSNGAIQSCNPATEKILGFQSDQLKHLQISDLLTDLGSEKPSQYTARLFQEARGHIVEKTARRMNGEEFPIELTITDFESSEKKLLLAIMLDITERQEIARLKREFVAIVSHELRTPLTSVMAFLSLLKAGQYGTMNDGALQKIENVDQSMERLNRLINDLLQVEKMELDSIELSLSEQTIVDLFERSMDDVRALAQKHDVAVKIESASALDGLQVTADRDRLIQVLVNLLSNAIKFSPAGSVVTLSCEPSSDGFVKISVKDEGPGIPPKQLEAIFEKFHQVHSDDHKVKGGSGLGLAIAKAIVNRHGGKIGVESETGKGATFWFTVALAPVEVHDGVHG